MYPRISFINYNFQGRVFYMKKRLLASVVVSALCVGFAAMASAAPMTDFNKGEGQIDLGTWHSNAGFDDYDFGYKWNLTGGVEYALANN